MVHVFYYLNGLDGTVGDLMALPRSQYSVMERGAFSALWQDYELPGSLTFGAKIPLPPGSAVIVHSALMHGRRAMPGGDPSKPRYFIDVVSKHRNASLARSNLVLPIATRVSGFDVDDSAVVLPTWAATVAQLRPWI